MSKEQRRKWGSVKEAIMNLQEGEHFVYCSTNDLPGRTTARQLAYQYTEGDDRVLHCRMINGEVRIIRDSKWTKHKGFVRKNRKVAR